MANVVANLHRFPPRWETKNGDHRSWRRTGTPSAWLFTRASRERNGKPCTTRYVELHEAVKWKNLVKNKKAKALCSLKEAKDKGTDFYDLGSAQKILSEVGPLGNPSEEPVRSAGNSFGMRKSVPSVTSEW